MAVEPPPPLAIEAVRVWWRRATGGLAPDLWQLWFAHIIPAWQEAGAPSLTSWYRSADLNRRVGGRIGTSQHLVGLAVDFEAGTPPDPFARRGFTAVVEDDHLHVQTFPAAVQVVRQIDALTDVPSSLSL